DGIEALEQFEKAKPDLIILDIMMPKLDGIAALMKIREVSHIPVIILSAKTQDHDKVYGLTLGADDYIGKPYNPAELGARVKALLRRYRAWNNAKEETKDRNTIENGGLILDMDSKQVLVDGIEKRLTATEYKIVKLFMNNLGKVYSAEEIYEKVWNEDADYSVENTVMVHIRRIREKIEPDTKNPKYIKVVWGIGYKMEKY
ncbi:MAG: response regulator transcription factor, partial [Lachnospiraceae bacterium]|nr:response regulator transcription factor [Lachnospiraceae bacterium]